MRSQVDNYSAHVDGSMPGFCKSTIQYMTPERATEVEVHIGNRFTISRTACWLFTFEAFRGVKLGSKQSYAFPSFWWLECRCKEQFKESAECGGIWASLQ